VYEAIRCGRRWTGQAHRNLVDCWPASRFALSCLFVIWKKKASTYSFATRKGTVKKTELKDFSHVMQRGIIAIGIDTDDELVGVSLTDGKQIVFLGVA